MTQKQCQTSIKLGLQYRTDIIIRNFLSLTIGGKNCPVKHFGSWNYKRLSSSTRYCVKDTVWYYIGIVILWTDKLHVGIILYSYTADMQSASCRCIWRACSFCLRPARPTSTVTMLQNWWIPWLALSSKANRHQMATESTATAHSPVRRIGHVVAVAQLITAVCSLRAWRLPVCRPLDQRSINLSLH